MAPGWGRLLVAGLIAVDLGCLAMNLAQLGSFWFLWVSPAVLVLYAVFMCTRTSQGADAPRSEAHVPVPA